MRVQVPSDHPHVLVVAQDRLVPQLQRPFREVDHPATGLLDLRALLLGDPLGHPPGNRGERVNLATADHLDHRVTPFAGLDHLQADVGPDLANHAKDVALRDRRVGSDQEVGPGEHVEVGRVVSGHEGAVEELAQERGGAWRGDAVDRVDGLGRGHVVRLGADTADSAGEGGHLLDGPADAEALEAAQLGDLEIGVGHLPGFVEQDLDLAVALQPGDRVDGQRGHALRPPRRSDLARLNR